MKTEVEIYDEGGYARCTLPNGRELYGRSVAELKELLDAVEKDAEARVSEDRRLHPRSFGYSH